MPVERLVPGDRVGAYVIQRRIGRGGMAEVFEAAREDGVVSRPVAIKLLRRGHLAGEDASVEKRFLAERQILAALNHPGIARLMDGGTTAGGNHYVVMEFVRGATLDEYVRERAPGLEAKLRLFADLCDAVHYAHRHLIVHRDLKPANVMVTEDGQVKLLDFGIAKLLRPEFWHGVDTPVTVPEYRMATPQYAAPEQLRGEVVTTSSDVYSLGVILYFLLAGRMPYEVENMDWPEIECLVATSDPRPLNTLEGPAVPRDLEAIVLTALRREPRDRYSSVEHLAEDIRRYLAHQPVRARRGEWIYPVWKFVRRHRVAAALGATLACVVAAAGLTLAWQARLLALERDLARNTTQFMFELFDSADPQAGTEPTVREALDEGARRLWKGFGNDPWMRAALAEKLGGVYSNLGHFRAALPLMEEAARVRALVFGPQSVEAASGMVALAGVLRHLEGQHERAEVLVRKAIQIQQGKLGKHDPLLAEALSVAGALAQQRRRAGEAEAAFREALAIRRASLPAADLRLAASLEQLGSALEDRGEHDGAFAMLREALAIRQKVWGSRHPRTVSSFGQLSDLALARRDTAEAVRLASEAVAIAQATLPVRHPDLMAALRIQAKALRAAEPR